MFQPESVVFHTGYDHKRYWGLKDVWIEKSLQVLAKLVPAEYAKQEKGATHVAELR